MRGTQLTEPSDTSRVNVFGQVLKELREAKGVQQATLAQRLDRSPSLLNLLEKGHRNPTRTIVNDLAHVLDLSDEDKLRLLRAGGLPEDEVSVAIQALVSTVSSRTPLDEADQLLLSNDLAHVLSRWKEAFEARKRLREGDAATAEAQLSAMAAAAAHTSALRA